ncbi:hypothetical protein KIH87_03340 [Paraneptunicella aestuarii]|uniref:hypothetical protein n=1 Tax=Paraneptunicella aestuarii TaxID=2831148 RepID=UPI001E444E55|nr:hypothetical protein [Paraneptunicella aestuarii]UAA39405.1 hypothetical protein KIH87_03340 [Paraneptunicella aestuarii]
MPPKTGAKAIGEGWCNLNHGGLSDESESRCKSRSHLRLPIGLIKRAWQAHECRLFIVSTVRFRLKKGDPKVSKDASTHSFLTHIFVLSLSHKNSIRIVKASHKRDNAQPGRVETSGQLPLPEKMDKVVHGWP